MGVPCFGFRAEGLGQLVADQFHSGAQGLQSFVEGAAAGLVEQEASRTKAKEVEQEGGAKVWEHTTGDEFHGFGVLRCILPNLQREQQEQTATEQEAEQQEASRKSEAQTAEAAPGSRLHREVGKACGGAGATAAEQARAASTRWPGARSGCDAAAVV